MIQNDDSDAHDAKTDDTDCDSNDGDGDTALSNDRPNDAKIENYLRSHPNIEKAAHHFRIDVGYIRELLKRINPDKPAEPPPQPSPPAEQPKSKEKPWLGALTAAHLFLNGWTLQEIADEYGVTKNDVRRLLVAAGIDPDKTWPRVDNPKVPYPKKKPKKKDLEMPI